MSDRLFFDWEQLLEAIPLSKSTIESEIRAGNFPKPRQISGRRVAWLVEDVVAWARARPVSELPPPPNTGAKKGKAE